MSGRMSSRSGNDFEYARHLLCVHIYPVGQTDLARDLHRILDTQLLACLLADADRIARPYLRGRNVDNLAVHLDALVADELAGFRARRGETHTVDDVVQPSFEQAQQILARRALELRGALVIAAELTLQDAVHATELLFLAKLQAVVRQTRTTLRRTARRYLEFALRLERPDATLQKQVRPFTAGQFALGS